MDDRSEGHQGRPTSGQRALGRRSTPLSHQGMQTKARRGPTSCPPGRRGPDAGVGDGAEAGASGAVGGNVDGDGAAVRTAGSLECTTETDPAPAPPALRARRETWECVSTRTVCERPPGPDQQRRGGNAAQPGRAARRAAPRSRPREQVFPDAIGREGAEQAEP